MFKVTVIKEKSLQSLLNRAALKIVGSEKNFCYRNIFGVTILQLLPQKKGFQLGISREAYSLGPKGFYSALLQSFLTGEPQSNARIPTKGVRTKQSTVETRKLAYQHRYWYSHLCGKISNLLNGDMSAVNSVVYPLAKHTFKNYGYKPCPTYVQYQIHEATESLSVVVNFRAQHLYMLAFNIQLWAFQLMQLCHKFRLRLGPVVLNCNNHHVEEGQDPQTICGKPLPWLVVPDETPALVKNVREYYREFRAHLRY